MSETWPIRSNDFYHILSMPSFKGMPSMRRNIPAYLPIVLCKYGILSCIIPLKWPDKPKSLRCQHSYRLRDATTHRFSKLPAKDICKESARVKKNKKNARVRINVAHTNREFTSLHPDAWVTTILADAFRWPATAWGIAYRRLCYRGSGESTWIRLTRVDNGRRATGRRKVQGWCVHCSELPYVGR